jgi:hypothetical protein
VHVQIDDRFALLRGGGDQESANYGNGSKASHGCGVYALEGQTSQTAALDWAARIASRSGWNGAYWRQLAMNDVTLSGVTRRADAGTNNDAARRVKRRCGY